MLYTDNRCTGIIRLEGQESFDLCEFKVIFAVRSKQECSHKTLGLEKIFYIQAF